MTRETAYSVLRWAAMETLRILKNHRTGYGTVYVTNGSDQLAVRDPNDTSGEEFHLRLTQSDLRLAELEHGTELLSRALADKIRAAGTRLDGVLGHRGMWFPIGFRQ